MGSVQYQVALRHFFEVVVVVFKGKSKRTRALDGGTLPVALAEHFHCHFGPLSQNSVLTNVNVSLVHLIYQFDGGDNSATNRKLATSQL